MRFLKVIFLVYLFTFSFSITAQVRIKEQLKTIQDLHSIMAKYQFHPEETAVVFDIDGTIVVEEDPLFNQELFREQQDDCLRLANELKVKPSQVIFDIQYFIDKEGRKVKLVEEAFPSVFRRLHEQQYLSFTCTRSLIPPEDFRLLHMAEQGIEFGLPYQNEEWHTIPFYDPYLFPDFFPNADRCSKFAFRGHSSAYLKHKSVSIDHIVEEIKKKRYIKNLVFIDNFKEEVNDVFKNSDSCQNVLALYYTHVKDNTNIDQLVERYNQLRAFYFPDRQIPLQAESYSPSSLSRTRSLTLEEWDELRRTSIAPSPEEDKTIIKNSRQLNVFVVPVLGSFKKPRFLFEEKQENEIPERKLVTLKVEHIPGTRGTPQALNEALFQWDLEFIEQEFAEDNLQEFTDGRNVLILCKVIKKECESSSRYSEFGTSIFKQIGISQINSIELKHNQYVFEDPFWDIAKKMLAYVKHKREKESREVF